MIGVVAVDRNGCIGKGNAIPWHYREDLAFFKQLTSGGTVILGRRTWEGLPLRPLPDRDHVVITRRPAEPAPRTRFTDLGGLDEALRGTAEPRFVIGGQRIYELLWPRIREFYVTRIPETVRDGDTFLTVPLEEDFRRVESAPLSERCTVDRYARR